MSEKSRADGDDVAIEPEYEEDHPTAGEGVARSGRNAERERAEIEPEYEEDHPARG